MRARAPYGISPSGIVNSKDIEADPTLVLRLFSFWEMNDMDRTQASQMIYSYNRIIREEEEAWSEILRRVVEVSRRIILGVSELQIRGALVNDEKKERADLVAKIRRNMTSLGSYVPKKRKRTSSRN